MAKKGNTKKEQAKQKELIRFISAIAIIGFSLVGWFKFGIIGVFINSLLRVLVGQYVIPYYVLIIVVCGLLIFKPQVFKQTVRVWFGVGLLFIAMVLILSLTFKTDIIGFNVFTAYLKDIPKIFSDDTVPAYGGIIGSLIYGLLSYLLDREGVIVFTVVFGLIGLALIVTPQRMLSTASTQTEKTKSLFEKMKENKQEKQKQKAEKKEENLNSVDEMIEQNYQPQKTKAQFLNLDDQHVNHDLPENTITKDNGQIAFLEPDEIGEEETIVSETSAPTPEKPKDDKRPTTYEKYKVPSLSLLEGTKGSSRSAQNDSSAKEKGQRLIEVLKQFGIDATLVNIHIGPAVTKFELKPDSNVKISKIVSIQDNLMMELAVKTLRIEAPIPGKSAVGIEIPNVEMMPVRMRDVIAQARTKFEDKDNVQVALGKDLMGNPIIVSLNKMPHLLVAGATGSGKSVCMNAIITSILLTKTPDELKLLLIDPKKVEFTPYTDIPHLMGPVISDPVQASGALKVVVEQMESRYDAFSKAGVRNIASFNEKVKAFPEEGLSPMPWIVVIIDELADLMAVAGKEVETSIQRITQLARAAGIHLIVATQRPSVDVVTGIIKANIPSRIAFAVSSAIDSRTILDTQGAEKLLGYGDMLYIPMGEPNATRVQGVYVSDEEVKKITERSSSQAKPIFDDAFIQLNGVEGNHGFVSQNDDPLYEEAFDFVILEQKASTSLLQRRFKIGYNRAANLIDALETNMVIGPANGSKPRDVYVKPDEEEI